MTHNEWEKGKRLTVHNATKEQLKWMVQDRNLTIKWLSKELEELKQENEQLIKSSADLVFKIIQKGR